MTEEEQVVVKKLLALAREGGFSISNRILTKNFTGKPSQNILYTGVNFKGVREHLAVNLWKHESTAISLDARIYYGLTMRVFSEPVKADHMPFNRFVPYVDIFNAFYDPHTPGGGEAFITLNLSLKYLIYGNKIVDI